VYKKGELFRSLAREIMQRHPTLVTDVRGWGLINGIEISESSSLMAADVTKKLMTEGVLVVPAGPKVIRFVPPLIITEEQIRHSIRKLENAIADLTKEAK
jgi:acetylornithine aminotransferase